MLALYKARIGLYRPIHILSIDLIADTVSFKFVRCNCKKTDNTITVVAYDEHLVDKPWKVGAPSADTLRHGEHSPSETSSERTTTEQTTTESDDNTASTVDINEGATEEEAPSS